MVLRIDGHTVIEAAAFYRIPANDAICRGVNLRHFVSGTQRYINPLRNGNVDHADCLTQCIGDVRLSKMALRRQFRSVLILWANA
jgi:hypothetical protein